MDISKFRHRVTVLKKTLGTDIGLGAPVTFTDDGKVWAEFLQQRVSTGVVADDGAAVLVTQGIRIRPRAVENGWRIQDGDHTYEVIDVDRESPYVYVLTTQEVRP